MLSLSMQDTVIMDLLHLRCQAFWLHPPAPQVQSWGCVHSMDTLERTLLHTKSCPRAKQTCSMLDNEAPILNWVLPPLERCFRTSQVQLHVLQVQQLKSIVKTGLLSLMEGLIATSLCSAFLQHITFIMQ